MSMKMRNVAVLGSGVMGAQIASLLGAAGYRVFIFDLPTLAGAEYPSGSPQYRAKRSEKALMSISALKTLKPTPIFSSKHLQCLEACNFEDDLEKLKECDWIIEAVVEKLDVKKQLFKDLSPYFHQDAFVTTNTSGIFLHRIAEALPKKFHPRFFGTHFFNPPRYMKLLEIIPHEGTSLHEMKTFASWVEEKLGKGIVFGRDTINFIANRLGTFCSHSAMRAMGELNVNIETVDELTGTLIGRSKSATFRTADIVGLDTGSAVAMNNYKHDESDPYREWFLPPRWFSDLVEKGALGQKTGNTGIYKKIKDQHGATQILVYRPEFQDYAPLEVQSFSWMKEAQSEKNLVKRIQFILAQKDSGAQFVWRNLRDMFAYASLFVGPIAEGDVKAVDDALKWGFNWQMGPFELWQALGYDTVFERMKQDHVIMGKWLKSGLEFYKYDDQKRPKSILKAPLKADNSPQFISYPRQEFNYDLPQKDGLEDSRIVIRNQSASLLDIGGGVAALVFHSKMNTINPQITEMIEKSLEKVRQDFCGMVIANDAAHFSAGADIRDFMAAIHGKKYDYIDVMEKAFHKTMSKLKFASFPIVACPQGLTLGGGCEVSLHTSRQILGAETQAGLVEVGVGLLPAGGGTKELALRAYELAQAADGEDPLPFLMRALSLIVHAKKSTSGYEAIEMGLYSPLESKAILSREHLTHRAKGLVLGLNEQGFTPKIPQKDIKVVGLRGIQAMETKLKLLLEQKKITAYDEFIGARVARILCGGEVPEGSLKTEADLLDLERIYFVELCQQPKTLERIEYMLKHGQPLKN